MQRTGGGRFLTEFGICGDDGNANSVNTVECNAILDEVDKRFESWTYWDGNFLDEMGNPIDSQVIDCLNFLLLEVSIHILHFGVQVLLKRSAQRVLLSLLIIIFMIIPSSSKCNIRLHNYVPISFCSLQ
ncbi:unnamed protein product [Trichobilharzia regenti]|nr:unnamed protein product [Trichobilharzia regenti]